MVFKFTLTDCHEEFHNEKYSYIYEYEGILTIVIDGKIFFEAPIAILEFFRDTKKWAISKELTDMCYECIETEENPLIQFKLTDGRFRLISPWQSFDSPQLFSKEEIVGALLELAETVNKQINVK